MTSSDQSSDKTLARLQQHIGNTPNWIVMSLSAMLMGGGLFSFLLANELIAAPAAIASTFSIISAVTPATIGILGAMTEFLGLTLIIALCLFPLSKRRAAEQKQRKKTAATAEKQSEPNLKAQIAYIQRRLKSVKHDAHVQKQKAHQKKAKQQPIKKKALAKKAKAAPKVKVAKAKPAKTSKPAKAGKPEKPAKVKTKSDAKPKAAATSKSSYAPKAKLFKPFTVKAAKSSSKSTLKVKIKPKLSKLLSKTFKTPKSKPSSKPVSTKSTPKVTFSTGR